LSCYTSLDDSLTQQTVSNNESLGLPVDYSNLTFKTFLPKQLFTVTKIWRQHKTSGLFMQ